MTLIYDETTERWTERNKMTLIYDETTERWTLGPRELHCGDCFKLFPDRFDLPAIEVRIEHSESLGGWYLLTPYGITKPSNREAALL